MYAVSEISDDYTVKELVSEMIQLRTSTSPSPIVKPCSMIHPSFIPSIQIFLSFQHTGGF